MSRVNREQVAAIYFVVLALFGVGLILPSTGLFCWLSAPTISSCMVNAVSPF
jgi:hypothetical protein